jgi:Ca-activated chloride channel homolog
MRRFLRTWLVVPLLAAPIAAQEPAVIRGTITEAASGAPVAAALVRVESLQAGVTTGADGRYALTIPAARFRAGQSVILTASHLGLATVSRQLVLQPGTSLVQDFQLQSASITIEGLVVTAMGVERERRTVSSSVQAISPDQLQGRAAGAAVSTPLTGANVAIRGANPAQPAQPGFNTEEYRHVQENRFLTVSDNPRSTFAIDVDRASYANVRRFLGQGMAPPVDAVRIEEMINYFSYDYAGPTDRHPFAVHTEVGRAPWNTRHQLVRVALQARRPSGEMPPSNLVFLIDVSGSMQAPNKLELVKESLRLLVDQLTAEDRVAIVVYAGAAGLVLDATPGNQRDRIMGAIERLSAGGSTAGAAGIQLAYEIARRELRQGGNNRVVLATDGDFNVGVSSEGELVRLIEREREAGVYLTVLGVGEGNLADARMEALADHGNGNYAYLDGIQEARKVMVEEVRGTLFTVAKDVKIQVEFNPARVAAYRLVGYENRMLQTEDFNDDRRDAGEMGAGHSVTALYEIVPVGVREPAMGDPSDPLRYQRPSSAGRPGTQDELMHVRVRYKPPTGGASRLLQHAVLERRGDSSESFRWATAVAEFGMLLRASEHRGQASLAHVLEEARAARGQDPGGWRAEFIRMVESYRGLALTESRRDDVAR